MNSDVERIFQNHHTFPRLNVSVEMYHNHDPESPMLSVELSPAGHHVHSDSCYDMAQLDLVCEHEEGFQPLTEYSRN